MRNTTKDQEAAIALIEEQQKGLPTYSPARMVGEQLKGIVLMDPEAAELVAQDLRVKGMGLQDAEKKIKARADEIHKTQKGNGVAVPPWEAEDILRKFYGLPERTWGPGKEPAGSPGEAGAASEAYPSSAFGGPPTGGCQLRQISCRTGDKTQNSPPDCPALGRGGSTGAPRGKTTGKVLDLTDFL